MNEADSFWDLFMNFQPSISTSHVFSHPSIAEVEARSVFSSSNRLVRRVSPEGKGEVAQLVL